MFKFLADVHYIIKINYLLCLFPSTMLKDLNSDTYWDPQAIFEALIGWNNINKELLILILTENNFKIVIL